LERHLKDFRTFLNDFKVETGDAEDSKKVLADAYLKLMRSRKEKNLAMKFDSIYEKKISGAKDSETIQKALKAIQSKQNDEVQKKYYE
jgi:hypothetical protein